jgi:2-keto-4-pentenoate hydratase/2-oxohepta-3-ene-1,7-dioic acid hydratase in catechol pathway
MGPIHALESLALLAPVPRPPLLRDFMGFETHLKNIYPRLGRDIPPEWYNLPVYYKGNAGSIGAHGDDIAIPSYTDELDFEFELALVIGSGGANIPREDAMQHVFGYMIYNDFSARAIQSREMSVGLGPAKGKDFMRGHVLGPWLVTPDEIPNVYDLRMVARVNGEVWCDESSSSIHWKFADMIAHASMDEALRPGEIFGSGTVGNGSGAERGVALKRGDIVELTVAGIGVLRNRVV